MADDAYSIDCRNAAVNNGLSGTLQCKENGGFSYNFINPVAYTLQIRSGCEGGGKGALVQEDKVAALTTVQTHTLFQPIAFAQNQRDEVRDLNDKAGALAAEPGMKQQNFVAYPMTMQAIGEYKYCEVASSCKMRDYKDATDLVCEPTVYDMTHANDVIRDCGAVSPTLQNRMGTGGNQVPLTVQRIIRWIVRRLTPMECERLQGYPDHWTDIGDWVDSKGKKHKGDADSPRYKALGNSIALPFWYWMFCRMAKFLPENATLGSLFDGIGGFPLCWEAIHGKGTARWASEIEEFPIAVTKIRFPEE